MSEPSLADHESAEITVSVSLLAGADANELDEATTRLRRELLDLNVERVERAPAGEAPAGARAGEIVALGGLVLMLARNREAIGSVVASLQSWLARDGNRSVKLELDGDALEVTGVSSGDQERLISAWIANHAGS